MTGAFVRRRVGELCRVIAGQSPEGKFYNTSGNGMPFYQGKKDFGEKFIAPPSNWTTQVTKIAEEGDILMSVRAPVGPVNFATERICIGRGLAAIRCGEELDREFLYYQLLYLQPEIQGRDGAVFASINKTEIGELPLVYMPLAEQRLIVGILDEAFAGIATAKANAERNLQNARALFESHLESIFTDPICTASYSLVKELAKHSLGKMLDKAKNRGDRKPYLRNLNVRWFEFNLSDLLEMPFLPSELHKYTVAKGDVVICEGGYPGRAAIWHSEEPIYFQKALHRVRFHQPEHSEWFLLYLYWQDSSGQLNKHFNGAGIQHFTGEALAKFPVPVPPTAHIARAVERARDLRAQCLELEHIEIRKLRALDDLKKSILEKAFAGDL